MLSRITAPVFSLCYNIMKLQTCGVCLAAVRWEARMACANKLDLHVWFVVMRLVPHCTVCGSVYVWAKEKVKWKSILENCGFIVLLEFFFSSVHSRYTMQILVSVFKAEGFASCCYSSYIRLCRGFSKYVALHFDYKGYASLNVKSFDC